MTEKKIDSNLATLIIAITCVFISIEILIWTGTVKLDALGNLGHGVDKLLENPAFVGILETLIVGAASGFMQNALNKNETFSLQKLGETFYYYEPLLILTSQFIPVKHAAVLLFAIDIFKRAFLKLVPPIST